MLNAVSRPTAHSDVSVVAFGLFKKLWVVI